MTANMPEGGGFTDLEHQTITATGETVWQWVSGKAVRDETGPRRRVPRHRRQHHRPQAPRGTDRAARHARRL
jgi:hypothetical protein